MLRKKILKTEKRSFDRILYHYEIEKKLAQTLLKSNNEDRAVLYNNLYDRLFRAVPDHPLLSQKITSEARKEAAKKSLKLIQRHLTPNSTFLEIGAGDCALSIAAAERVRRVYAVDVSKELTNPKKLPTNLEVIISDGTSLPLSLNSVDIAYSNQLMEHLHPHDAIEQLKNIFNVLKKGGFYYCITPNRLTGPHDISYYFDDISTCFHLKEYTNAELCEMFRRVGFRNIKAYIGKQGFYLRFPMRVKIAIEKICCHFTHRVGQRLIRFPPVRLILRIVTVGVK